MIFTCPLHILLFKEEDILSQIISATLLSKLQYLFILLPSFEV